MKFSCDCPGGLISTLDKHTGIVYYYFYDANGNVGQLVNAVNGSIAAHYEYDPYGNELVASGPEASSNTFRFSTKYHDLETGLVYYGYRYYSPELGRWLTRDPLGEKGGLNLYKFNYNDSINLWDFIGLESDSCRCTFDKIEMEVLAGRLDAFWDKMREKDEEFKWNMRWLQYYNHKGKTDTREYRRLKMETDLYFEFETYENRHKSFKELWEKHSEAMDKYLECRMRSGCDEGVLQKTCKKGKCFLFCLGGIEESEFHKDKTKLRSVVGVTGAIGTGKLLGVKIPNETVQKIAKKVGKNIILKKIASSAVGASIVIWTWDIGRCSIKCFWKY